MTFLAATAGSASSLNVGALALGLFLLLANGYFVAAEIALLAARRTRIEELAASGDRRAELAVRALRELSITFSGAQLGITLASLGLGAVAEPALAAVFERVLGDVGIPESLRPAIGFGTALALVVFLHMVIGEMAPKNLALARAENVAVRIARSFHWFVTLFRPLIVVLNGAANILVRSLGVEPVDERNLVHTPGELRFVLAESQRRGTLRDPDARVLAAALRLADITAEDAMTPRTDLTAVAASAPVGEILDVAGRTGHTRLPVYQENLDEVIGLVHVKDVLVRDHVAAERLVAADVLRPIAAVPHSRDLESLLAELLATEAHAVLVVDEFGGTAGLVTLEDVLEELVGDIADEFDLEEPPRHRGDRWTVTGTLRRDELERLTGLVLEAGDSETVSGWITEQLGRLVRSGDAVQTPDGWWLRVRSLEGRRAGEVEVEAPLGSPDPSGSVG